MLSWSRVLSATLLLLVVWQDGIRLVTGTITCKGDRDCTVNCNNATYCVDQKINCPTSSNSTTYSCTVLCTATNSCVRTTIETGKSVNAFTLQANKINASRSVEIIAEGTSKVSIICNGGASSCDYLKLNMTGGNSMLLDVTSSGSELREGEVAFSHGAFFIKNTASVLFACETTSGCYSHKWIVTDSQNVTVECNGENSCDDHNVSISRSTLVTIQSSTSLPSITQTTMELVNLSSLIIQTADSAIQNGDFSLRNINKFLLDIAETGNTYGTKWQAYNVSNVAINTWDAISFWLVEGTPIQSSYSCDATQDCNIRVDASPPEDMHVDISCPKETNVKTTCTFYCTAITGCNLDLFTVDTSNVALYFVESYNPTFSLSADIVGLTTPTTLNLTCTYPYSCANNSFHISGYDTVYVSCLDYFACERAYFNIGKFSTEARIMSNSQSMYKAQLFLTDGFFAFITSEDTHYSGLAFRHTSWTLASVAHVHVYCGHNSDCANATFSSYNIKEMLVRCGSGGGGGDNCINTVFNNYQNSSFYLTCQEGDYSCDNTAITYDGSDAYDTSCTIVCGINPNNPENPNCRNMNITVNNNPRGYDAISLTCATSGLFTACQDVSIICDNDRLTCRCPMVYDEYQDEWSCDGQCGTSECGGSSSSSSGGGGGGLSAGATAAIVLSVLIVVGILGFFAYQHYKKRRVESQLFVPLGKHANAPTVQNTSGSYQNL